MIHESTDLTRREGIVFILSAPSGTGKTTLIKRLREIYPEMSLLFPIRRGRAEPERSTDVTTISSSPPNSRP